MTITLTALKEKIRRKELYFVSVIGVLILLVLGTGNGSLSIAYINEICNMIIRNFVINLVIVFGFLYHAVQKHITKKFKKPPTSQVSGLQYSLQKTSQAYP